MNVISKPFSAGAITTIATVAIRSDGPQNAVAIGGGLLSAGQRFAQYLGSLE